MNPHVFDWSDLAFDNKKPLRKLKAVFIAAPRELSTKRFTELVKTYLLKGNIVLGIAKEPFVEGFEGQPQFAMLRTEVVQAIVDKVNNSASKNKIYILNYFQRELSPIVEKLSFQKVLLINGSWKHSFHTLPAYYSLVNRRISYEMLSPFTDEQEAKTYEEQETTHLEKLVSKHLKIFLDKKGMPEDQLLELTQIAASLSFDHTFQTGATLAKKVTKQYKFLTSACNKVVPFQTYAMLWGASREKYFSPPNDLNHYDTVHAEVEVLLKAQKQNINLKGTTLCVNLMPCPTCARMLCETDIAEIIYSLDHSDGYAVRILEKAGKIVRRVLSP